MQVNGAGDIARLLTSQHLCARSVVASITGLDGPEEGRLPGSAEGLDPAQKLGEYALFVRDLVVEAVVLGQKGHGPVMALCGDCIEHLLCVVYLLLESGNILRPLIEAIDDDDREAGHPHEKRSGGQKAGEQFRVHTAGDRSHQVHERLQRPSEPRQPNRVLLMDAHPWLSPTKRATVSANVRASLGFPR